MDDGNGREQTREELQLQLQQYEHAIMRIRTRLNTMLPVSRLPFEVLADIFGYLALLCRATSRPYAWVHVTHVCQTWRQVAIQCPTLWADLVLPGRPDCIYAAMKRAKAIPLTVTASEGISSQEKILGSLKIVMRNIHRIRSLELTISWNTFASFSRDFALSEAPLLQKLQLSAPIGLSQIGRIPHVFNSCPDPPPLEHIDLYRYCYPWPRLRDYTKLKHLRLGYDIHSRNSHEETVTMAGVLDTLEALHLLETLDIQNDLPAIDTTIIRTVTLPSLRQLALSGPPLNCAALLDHLIVPATACIAVTDIIWPTYTQFLHFLPAVVAKVVGATTIGVPRAFKSLALRREGSSFEFRAWTAEQPIEIAPDYLDRTTPKMWLDIPCHTLSLIHACAQLSLAEAHTLWLSSAVAEIVDSASVIRILSGMASVNAVRFVEWDANEVTSVLSSDRTEILEAGNGTAGTYVLPCLHTIVLDEVKFNHCPGSGHLHTPRCVQILHAALCARKSTGCEVKRLIVRNCEGVTESQIDSLKEVIDEVDWDGQ
ncbi:hypothetical protein PHLCEN_2v4043 [Hermanssonia centrifuga]|uniref:F-box domain-containing protein n=1 Tax=Hermanssonia centrifuga TaxID=98765 RepID=A0A2R6Q5F9_9APHY|nr:hypothetical protein PHLCEN_2v4043 [Hermanssonia centrifuga]